jgi:hypothetical protein
MSSISEKINIIYNSKNDIKTAISNKGVEAGDDISKYASLIDSISTESKVTDNIDYFWIENTRESDGDVCVYPVLIADFLTGHIYVQYSQDQLNWTTIRYDYSYTESVNILCGSVPESVVRIPASKKMYFRTDYSDEATTPLSFSIEFDEGMKTTYNYTPLSSCNVGGSLCSLVDYNDPCSKITKNGQFYNFLYKMPVVDASSLILPFDELTENCYCGMFLGCTTLKYAPKILPSITPKETCYQYMFKDCDSLETLPEIMLTSINAYGCIENIFATNLTIKEVKIHITDKTTKGLFNCFWSTDTITDFYCPLSYYNLCSENSDPIPSSTNIHYIDTKLEKITQTAYDVLTTKDDNTIYLVTNDTSTESTETTSEET